jgi:hypothetical protein
LRDERAAAVTRERGGLRIVVCVGEEGAEHPLLSLGLAHHLLGGVCGSFDELGYLVA